MLVTDYTRQAITARRLWRAWQTETQRWLEEGFIPIQENGDPLWKFYRGDWATWNPHRIVDVRIAPNGKEVWIKVERAMNEFERLSRAVCKAWGMDPDKRYWDSDDSFMCVGWRTVTVKRHVQAHMAMCEAQKETTTSNT